MCELNIFRITVHLSQFYNDHRAISRVFINENMKCIGDLQKHIAGIFDIKHKLVLHSENHFLPPAEDIRVLQKEDVVFVTKMESPCLIEDDGEDSRKRRTSNECDSIRKKRKIKISTAKVKMANKLITSNAEEEENFSMYALLPHEALALYLSPSDYVETTNDESLSDMNTMEVEPFVWADNEQSFVPEVWPPKKKKNKRSKNVILQETSSETTQSPASTLSDETPKDSNENLTSTSENPELSPKKKNKKKNSAVLQELLQNIENEISSKDEDLNETGGARKKKKHKKQAISEEKTQMVHEDTNKNEVDDSGIADSPKSKQEDNKENAVPTYDKQELKKNKTKKNHVENADTDMSVLQINNAEEEIGQFENGVLESPEIFCKSKWDEHNHEISQEEHFTEDIDTCDQIKCKQVNSLPNGVKSHELNSDECYDYVVKALQPIKDNETPLDETGIEICFDASMEKNHSTPLQLSKPLIVKNVNYGSLNDSKKLPDSEAKNLSKLTASILNVIENCNMLPQTQKPASQEEPETKAKPIASKTFYKSLDQKAVMKPGRRRRRGRNKKGKHNALELDDSLGSSPEVFEFLPPNTEVTPASHIRFGDVEYEERPCEVTPMVVDVEDEEAAAAHCNPQDPHMSQDVIRMFAKMTKTKPKKGDLIAFQILKMSENYNPEVSEFLTANVMHYDPQRNEVDLQIVSGLEALAEPIGKFSLNPEAEEEEQLQSTNRKIFNWADLRDPRLLYP